MSAVLSFVVPSLLAFCSHVPRYDSVEWTANCFPWNIYTNQAFVLRNVCGNVTLNGKCVLRGFHTWCMTTASSNHGEPCDISTRTYYHSQHTSYSLPHENVSTKYRSNVDGVYMGSPCNRRRRENRCASIAVCSKIERARPLKFASITYLYVKALKAFYIASSLCWEYYSLIWALGVLTHCGFAGKCMTSLTNS